MRVIINLENINKELQNSCLTIGNFDGVHLGHQKILKLNKEIAQDNNQKSALLTFEPHPRHFFNPKLDKNVRIYSLSQKLEILKEENLVDVVFLIHFNQDLANLTANKFIEKILFNKLKISNLTIGYDFNFGKDRQGNGQLLKESSLKYGYNFHQIDVKKDQNNQIYSSTLIRNLIKSGKVQKAYKILGRNYEIKGIVVNGNKMGREIGFKTVNILPKFHIIKPKFGVYKSVTNIDGKKYNSITNFGIKPTLNGKKEVFETHIFNFNQDIYYKNIKVELLEFIREERKFNNIEELKEQIKKDCDLAKNTN